MTADTPESRHDRYAVLDVYFSAGQTVCDEAIPMLGWVPVGLKPDSATAASAVTFQADADDGDFREVTNMAGETATVTATGSVYVVLPPPDFPGFPNLKLVLDTAATARENYKLIVRKVND